MVFFVLFWRIFSNRIILALSMRFFWSFSNIIFLVSYFVRSTEMLWGFPDDFIFMTYFLFREPGMLLLRSLLVLRMVSLSVTYCEELTLFIRFRLRRQSFRQDGYRLRPRCVFETGYVSGKHLRSDLNICFRSFWLLLSYWGFGRSYLRKLKFLGSFIVFNRFCRLFIFSESVTFFCARSVGFEESELVRIIEESMRSSVVGRFSGLSWSMLLIRFFNSLE